MNIFKRCFPIFFLLLISFTVITSCSQNDNLTNNIIELRENVFTGEYDQKQVTCYYGFKTCEGVKKYALTFILPSDTANALNVEVSLKNGDYKTMFTLREISGTFTAEIPVDGLAQNTFTAIFTIGSEKSEIEFTSVIPENTFDSNKAIEYLIKNQPTLIESLYENGEFTAKIILRVMVKNEKPFWYVGIKKDNSLKAFLLDGRTGEVLAIRDII